MGKLSKLKRSTLLDEPLMKRNTIKRTNNNFKNDLYDNNNDRNKLKKYINIYKYIFIISIIVLLLSIILSIYGDQVRIDTNINSSIPSKSMKKESIKSKEKYISKKKNKDLDSIFYDDYVAFAKQQQWSIIDPVEKLHSHFTTYCKAATATLDLSDKNSNGVVEAIKQEISFIIKILKRSKDHEIDLSVLAFDTLDATQQCYYQITKLFLYNHEQKWISRNEVERRVSQLIYYPIIEILRLKSDIEEQVNELSHITINLNDHLGRGGLNFFSLATSYKFYRLLSILIGFNLDYDGVVFQAIKNRDDLALSILLQNQQIAETLYTHQLPSPYSGNPYEFSLLLKDAVVSRFINEASTYWNFTEKYQSIIEHANLNQPKPLDIDRIDDIIRDQNVRQHLGSYGGYSSSFVEIQRNVDSSSLLEGKKTDLIHSQCSNEQVQVVKLSLFSIYHLMKGIPLLIIDDMNIFETEFGGKSIF